MKFSKTALVESLGTSQELTPVPSVALLRSLIEKARFGSFESAKELYRYYRFGILYKNKDGYTAVSTLLGAIQELVE